MLNRNEFKSIWEVAHRWEEVEPPPSIDNEAVLSLERVIDKIERISWAFLRRKFPLRELSGRRILDGDGILDHFVFNWSRNRLIRCLERKNYPGSFIDGLYVMRGDLLKWCEEEFLTPPEFWMEETNRSRLEDDRPAGKELVGRH